MDHTILTSSGEEEGGFLKEDSECKSPEVEVAFLKHIYILLAASGLSCDRWGLSLFGAGSPHCSTSAPEHAGLQKLQCVGLVALGQRVP